MTEKPFEIVEWDGGIVVRFRGRTPEDLVETLEAIARFHDHDCHGTEIAHIDADRALLDFIGDPRVTRAFDLIEKWYA